MSHVSANERIMTCAVPNGSKWCHSLFRRTSEMPCRYSALTVQLAARQVGFVLLHQLAGTAGYPTGIPRPHPVQVVLPPATTAVKTVAILIRQLHVATAVVPTDANQPTLLVILQQPRVARPRKTRQRAVRVPDVGLGGVGCSVYYLNQPACAVIGIRATMRQMVKVLKVFRNFQKPQETALLH
jgi:hypothetical protein